MLVRIGSVLDTRTSGYDRFHLVCNAEKNHVILNGLCRALVVKAIPCRISTAINAGVQDYKICH